MGESRLPGNEVVKKAQSITIASMVLLLQVTNLMIFFV